MNGSSNAPAFAIRRDSPLKRQADRSETKGGDGLDVSPRSCKKMGLDGAVCLGCGSADLSTFQFDHIAGRKHADELWPLCENCHQEKTFMDYLEPTSG